MKKGGLPAVVGDFRLPWAPVGPLWAPVGPRRSWSALVGFRRPASVGPPLGPRGLLLGPRGLPLTPVVSLWAPMVSHWAPVPPPRFYPPSGAFTIVGLLVVVVVVVVVVIVVIVVVSRTCSRSCSP